MKKIVHCYASQEFPAFDSGTADEELCDSMLTKEMVLCALKRFASGIPPYRLVVPVMCYILAYEWLHSFPAGMFTVEIVEGKGQDCVDPYDTAMVDFRDTTAIIHFRRLRTNPQPCS